MVPRVPIGDSGNRCLLKSFSGTDLSTNSITWRHWFFKQKRISISKTSIVRLTGRVLYTLIVWTWVLWWACCVFSAMIEMTRHVDHLFDLWQWWNFSRIEALEFSRIYTRVLPAPTDVFPVLANTRTKSIRVRYKHVWRILDLRWSRKWKPLASKSCFV